MLREVIRIDEEKCDGCGDCVPACHEGAIRIVAGKARLVADVLCDGLGACLGHCPQGAITVERREADPFDEGAVESHLAALRFAPPRPAAIPASNLPMLGSLAVSRGGGCPSAQPQRFDREGPAAGDRLGQERAPSELTHWPVQLNLLAPNAPVLQGARLLVAADCVPVAFSGFHAELLRGRAVVIGCPKFDDMDGSLTRLTEMIRQNDLAEITVARMEVPCCSGILMTVLEARQRSGKSVPVFDVVIGRQGDLLGRREMPGH